MADENGRWRRQDESFWRAHHEAWKRSDLNQRQYCEAERIPLKAFGNWRAVFEAEPQPPERKLLYRRRARGPRTSRRATATGRRRHDCCGTRARAGSRDRRRVA